MASNDDEVRAIAEVCRRLLAKFPHRPPELVESLVASLHREYDGRPIRDFVPVLVERDAAARLAHPVSSREHTEV